MDIYSLDSGAKNRYTEYWNYFFQFCREFRIYCYYL